MTRVLGGAFLAGAIAAAGPAGAANLCDTAGLRSPGSNDPTTFVVVNAVGDRSADIYWVDFNGQQVKYGTIPPNGRFEQSTYRGHIWAIENSFGYCDVVFTAHNNVEIIIR